MDPLRLSGEMKGLYLEDGEDTSYARAGVGSLLKLQSLSLFKAYDMDDDVNDLGRLRDLYKEKSTVSNVSANIDHYSYRAFSYRYVDIKCVPS